MLHTLSRRIPLRNNLLPLKSHIRAPLSLDDETPIYGLLARRAIPNSVAPDSIARRLAPHLFEVVASPYPFDAWGDIWNLTLRLKDKDNLTACILQALDELHIDVLHASAAVTFSGVNDTVSFVLDCRRYRNDIDGTSEGRVKRERWRLRFLETLLVTRLVESIRIEGSGRPSVSLRRLEALRRIRLRLERVGLLGEDGPRLDAPKRLDPNLPRRRDARDESRDRIQLAFVSRIASMASIETAGDDVRKGIQIPATLGKEFALAIHESSASGQGDSAWETLWPSLAAMSMFDPRDMLVRSILTTTHARLAPLPEQLVGSAYLQIAMPKDIATAAFLKKIFEILNAHVATIEKYLLRPGFVAIPQLKKARRDHYNTLLKLQKEKQSVCRLDLVVVLESRSSVGDLAKIMREKLTIIAPEKPIGIFTEHDWIARGSA